MSRLPEKEFYIYELHNGLQWILIGKEKAAHAGTACELWLGKFFERYTKVVGRGYARQKKVLGVSEQNFGSVIMPNPDESVESRFIYLYYGW